MGSWSETCGISGLEIAEGDPALICLISQRSCVSLNEGAFCYYQPTTTLIRGSYNDYGQLRVADDPRLIRIFNEQSGISLSNGDDFDLDKLHPERSEKHWGHRWWCHGDVYDYLSELTPEFPMVSDPSVRGYSAIEIRNVGEAQDFYYAALGRMIEEADLTSPVDSMILRSEIDRVPLLDLDSWTTDLDAGQDPSPRLLASRRVSTLGYGMYELRRALGPCESVGPQHSGEEALLQMSSFLATRCGDQMFRRRHEESL